MTATARTSDVSTRFGGATTTARRTEGRPPYTTSGELADKVRAMRPRQ